MTNVQSFIRLMIDPSTIGTPQQKRYGFSNGRIHTFANPRVARAKSVMCMMARNIIKRQSIELPPHGTPVAVTIVMYYAIPKCRQKAHKGIPAALPRTPCTSHAAGDVDNKAKGILDALTQAGLWSDDKDVTTLTAAKVWADPQLGPCIEITVKAISQDECQFPF